jgi:hypothetical protein
MSRAFIAVKEDTVYLNGKPVGDIEKTVRKFLRERDFENLYLLCERSVSEETLEAEVKDVPALPWVAESAIMFGNVRLVRFKASTTFPVKYDGANYTVKEGELSGWVLDCPDNIKALRERSLYIDERSKLFGIATGKCVISNSTVIGTLKNSSVNGSYLFGVNAEKSEVRDSQVEHAQVEFSKILHSHVIDSVLNNAIISSSFSIVRSTVIESQLTDVCCDSSVFSESTVMCEEVDSVILVGEKHLDYKRKRIVGKERLCAIQIATSIAENNQLRAGAIRELKDRISVPPVWQGDQQGTRTVMSVSQ